MKIIHLLLLIFTAHTAFADISSITIQGEKVTQLGTGMKFTEGPVWIKKEKRLIFSDIPNSLQMEWTSAKGVKEWRKVEQSNGNLMDLNGNILFYSNNAPVLLKKIILIFYTKSDSTLSFKK